MGVYRRKDKNGEPFGPWIVQYPSAINPRTGKQKYACIKAGESKRLADTIFAHKILEWEKKRHLGLETKREFVFRELAEWYLGLPRVQAKRSYAQDVSRMAVLLDEFGNCNVREIKPAMIEAFQHWLLKRRCRRGKGSYAPATVNRFLEIMKRIFNLALREDMVEKNPCLKVSKLAENNRRDRVITHAQYQTLVAALPKYAVDIVINTAIVISIIIAMIIIAPIISVTIPIPKIIATPDIAVLPPLIRHVDIRKSIAAKVRPAIAVIQVKIF